MKEDIYIRMRPPRFSYEKLSEFPQELLPLYDTIRGLEEWKDLGFPVKFADKYELNIEQLSPDQYEFSRIRSVTPDIEKAILNKKKHVEFFYTVLAYLRAGCTFDDFSELPEDQKNFCLGIFSLEENNLLEALNYFEKAVLQRPKEARYREKYYEVGLKLGRLHLIQDEIEHFKQDIDVSIHTGRFDVWVNSLIKDNRLSDAKAVMVRVELYLQSLAEGKVDHLYYAKSDISFYKHKMEKLKISIEKYNKRIQKIESVKK